MSFVIANPYRRPGRPRCVLTHMLALEYLMWPGKRPQGLQKTLAYANGITPGSLNKTIGVI